ncbi:MAG: hypothetical protein JNM18_23825 [Planctomycetaceae bacterium]|nr:hypothetical protein [Planctomycetaceae bacterium]
MHYLPQDPDHEHPRGDVRGGSPRVRVMVAAVVVLGVSALPAQIDARLLGQPVWGVLAGIGLGLLVARAWLGVPWRYLVMRWALFLPWVTLMALAVPLSRGSAGWPVFVGMVLKAWLGFTTLLLLVRSSSSDDLLRGLESLGVPQLLVATIATMERYVALFRSEFQRLRRAQAARTFGQSRWQQFTTSAGLLGLVLARSYDRAERVHAAMLARGYRGTMPHWERRPAAEKANTAQASQSTR